MNQCATHTRVCLELTTVDNEMREKNPLQAEYLLRVQETPGLEPEEAAAA